MAERLAPILLLALLAACGESEAPVADLSPPAASGDASAPAAAPTPDLARCDKYEPIPGDERQRTVPLAVPAALKPIMASDMDHLAVLTLSGATLCLDARWMDAITPPALGEGDRLLAFGWTGYEAYGFQLVDRHGSGQAIETGEPPARSPSGQRFASIDASESGYGGLNAFAVWQIGPDKVRELAKVVDIPPAFFDWKIDRWVGETCLELSAIRFEDLPQGNDWSKAPRPRFVAEAPREHWQLRGPGATCPTG